VFEEFGKVRSIQLVTAPGPHLFCLGGGVSGGSPTPKHGQVGLRAEMKDDLSVGAQGRKGRGVGRRDGCGMTDDE